VHSRTVRANIASRGRAHPAGRARHDEAAGLAFGYNPPTGNRKIERIRTRGISTPGFYIPRRKRIKPTLLTLAGEAFLGRIALTVRACEREALHLEQGEQFAADV